MNDEYFNKAIDVKALQMKELKTLEAKRNELKEKIKNINNDPLIQNSASVYARISGYVRSVNLFNTGKAQEFKERKTYNLM